jgi:hypothetical protein
VKLLSDYRRDLVRQRTQLCNKIRWFLHELNPSFDVPSRGFRRRCVIARVEAELATTGSLRLIRLAGRSRVGYDSCAEAAP